MIMHKTP